VTAIVETARLVLRMLREDDFEAYARIFTDPEVTRYLGDGSPLDRFGAWRSLAFNVGHWALRGYGMWAVEEKASGRLVGRVGAFYPEGWPPRIGSGRAVAGIPRFVDRVAASRGQRPSAARNAPSSVGWRNR
jgi:RimJ/RimL family protein N-acetyltransferase